MILKIADEEWDQLHVTSIENVWDDLYVIINQLGPIETSEELGLFLN